MKNITVKIDDETYRKARVRAAQNGTSVSAMVQEFLSKMEDDSDREKRRSAMLEKLYAETDAAAKAKPRKKSFKPLTREEIYGERLRG